MAGSTLVSLLEQHLTEYLAVRRAMGYKLARAGKLLLQFTGWMAERDQRLINTELALEWATLPQATAPTGIASDWRSFEVSPRTCTRSTRRTRCRQPICCRGGRGALFLTSIPTARSWR